MVVEIGGVVVRSDHPDASVAVAHAIAGVFMKYWLEGCPEDEALIVEVGPVPYEVSASSLQ